MAWRIFRLTIFAVIPLLALRWPLPIALATLRGEGAMDRTVVAFLVPFFLMLAGYPGFLAAAAGLDPPGRGTRAVLVLSVLLVLISALLVLLWMTPAVMTMRSTLRHPISNLLWVLPPLVTVVLAVLTRRRLVRVVSQK